MNTINVTVEAVVSAVQITVDLGSGVTATEAVRLQGEIKAAVAAVVNNLHRAEANGDQQRPSSYAVTLRKQVWDELATNPATSDHVADLTATIRAKGRGHQAVLAGLSRRRMNALRVTLGNLWATLAGGDSKVRYAVARDMEKIDEVLR